MSGANAGALDHGYTSAPPFAGATAVYDGGRHIGWVWKYRKGGEWWSRYLDERTNPLPAKTKREAEEKVQRNHAARSARITPPKRDTPLTRARDGYAAKMDAHRARFEPHKTDAPAVPAYPFLDEPARASKEERQARADRRAEARQTEADFTAALEARTAGAAERRIKAPPPREHVAKRFGGGTRARTDDYDWFYELATEEQARIRSNWMTSSSAAVTPDEIEAGGLPIHEWLALTRGIDAARAVQTGRHLQAKRYGGRNPLAYLERGRPEDHGTRVDRFESEHGGHDIDPDAGVQFFTDPEGIVHPIRASYEHRRQGDELDEYDREQKRRRDEQQADIKARANAHGWDPDDPF